MLASEYSPMCSEGGEFWNSSNRCRSLAISASGACSVARRADMLSSAAHIWIISMISRLDLRMMKMPRRGTVRMKPSCSRIDSASRIGVRLTPSAVISSRSSSRSG